MLKRFLVAAFSCLVLLGGTSTSQAGLLVAGEIPTLGSPGNDGALLEYDNSGAYRGVFNSGGPTPDGFSSMVRGADGNVYALSGSTFVYKYDGTTGAYIRTFVDGSLVGVTDAKNIAFGPDGNLYIATGDHGTVDRFDGTTGAFIDHFLAAGAGGTGTQTLAEVMSLAFGKDGLLYVGNDARALNVGNDAYNVLRFNATTGAFVGALVTDNANGLYDPNALVFGPDNNLYISNEGNTFPSIKSNILRYNPTTGAFIDAFVGENSGGLQEPIGFMWPAPHFLVQ